MDDLEHSVLISEQDWYSFYEESEECCIQQARLAGLDDSGLSDTDDETNSIGNQSQPVLPPQTDPEKSTDEYSAAAQTLYEAGGCEIGTPPDDSELFCYKTEQIEASVNSGQVVSPENQQNNVSHTENFKKHDQGQSEDKVGKVLDEPITILSTSGTQNTRPAASSEEETVTKVMESSAAQKEEKERWFVTVNDSPIHQKVHSGMMGQKKRRKKKSSWKLGHQSRVTGVTNDEKKAEEEGMKEKQKAQDEFKQPNKKHFYFNTLPDKNEVTSGLLSVKEPGEEHCENSSLLKSSHTSAELSSISKDKTKNVDFIHKSVENVPTENPEKIPSASTHSSSIILTNSSQLQASFMTQLANDQSMSNHPENTDITTENPPVSLVHDNPEEYNSRRTCLSSTPSEDLQKCSTRSHNEEETSSLQEPHNQEPLNETMKGPCRPVYALSSFWDEMERLTINDILQLRVADRRSPSSCDNSEEINVHLGDSSLMDDTADSDYFTHSKPERSSCEFSTFSDFDEDFLQIINTSPELQNVKEQSGRFYEFLPEQDLTTVHNDSQSEDLDMQHGIPLYLYPATDAQNLLLTCEMDRNKNPFEAFKNTPSPVLSVGNVLEDQCSRRSSFPEIFVEDTDGEGPQMRTSDRYRSVVSVYSSETLSVPETYDDFFSDFVVGNLFFPSVEDQTLPVPIFSSSRSVVRELVIPEAWELIESDFEDENLPVRVKTLPERSTSPSGTPNIYFFTSQRRNWRSFLSLRRMRFIGKGRTWWQKVSSWMFPEDAKNLTSYIPSALTMPQEFHIGNTALVPIVKQWNYVQHSASISKSFSIKQADMCLVCIAVASWVLKSSNPQSTDMWKAALLANVSAISAIQYLRKYLKKEEPDDDPQCSLI